MVDGRLFHFMRPSWLFALFAVAALVYLWHRMPRSLSRWHSVVDPRLARFIIESEAHPRRSLATWLAAACCALAIVGLAGPSFRQLPNATRPNVAPLVIVLDLSLSMYARDLQPSRLVRAQQKIKDILKQRQDGVTALIVYAGDAHVVTPLTDDVRTIGNLLDNLEPAIMPTPGSDLRDALRLANQLLENVQSLSSTVLILTDEIADPTDLAAANHGGQSLVILGFGTEAGAPIPLDLLGQQGQFLTDRAGNPVIARLDTAKLADAARSAHADYRTATASSEDLNVLLNQPQVTLDQSNDARIYDVWADDGYWLALPLLAVLLGVFRRGALAALMVVPFLAPPAQAFEWKDLWSRPDQQGYAALNEGSPAQAATLFRAPAWRGAALYRANRFNEAVAPFAADPSATAQYNRGNALAKSGHVDAAIQAYDQALKLDPNNADAAFNRDLLKRLQQQQAQQSKLGKGHSGPAQKNQQERSAASPSERDAPAPTHQSTGRDDRRPSPAQAQTNAAATKEEERKREERDAHEQWLRRIPDDPGGLLRRKFEYEYRDRYGDGGFDRRSDRVW